MPASARAISFGGGHDGSGLLKELEAELQRRSNTPPGEDRPSTAGSGGSGDSGFEEPNWIEITPDEGTPYHKDTNYENGNWVRIKQIKGKNTKPYYWNTNTGEVAEEDPRQATSTDA